MKKTFTKTDNFVYPPSVQNDLFNYLKPEQQEFVRPILRVMKKPAQMELCCMLLDSMETGEVEMGMNTVVCGMFTYLTRYGMKDYDNASDPRIIRPLSITKSLKQKFSCALQKFLPNATSHAKSI